MGKGKTILQSETKRENNFLHSEKMDELRHLKTYLKGLRADLARTNKIRKEMGKFNFFMKL